MRVTKFNDRELELLQSMIEDNKGCTDTEIRTKWVAAIGKSCSAATFSRHANAISRRYKVKRKSVLSEKNRVDREATALDFLLNSGQTRYRTLYVDEKWFSQVCPTTVRCLSSSDPARYAFAVP